MKKNTFYLLSLITLVSFTNMSAQVGLGRTNPEGALDLNPTVLTNYAFIPPRVSLTDAVTALPVVNPQGGALAEGTVVYNTSTSGSAPNKVGKGLYYWNLFKWIAFAGSPGGLDWTLTGNESTVPGTYAAPGVNYLGTSDATALHITTNNLPRIRVTTNGNVGVGASSLATVRLNVAAIAAATDSALFATSQASNSGTITPTASISNTATDYVTGLSLLTEFVPTIGASTDPNIALRAASGVATFLSPAVKQNIGIAANALDLAFYGVTEGTTATTRRAAEFRTNDAGVSNDADANDPFAYLAGYAAGATITDPVNGTNIRNVKYGGYFYGGSANAYAYVGVRLSSNIGPSSNYKIIGPGTVSTIVAGDKPNDAKKIMFAPEAPEVLFEDYGSGKLVNGIAVVNMDPIFAKNTNIDDKRPLKVFIQLEGDCNGIFVTNKSKKQFTVKELSNGKSNVSFSWHVVANRADEVEKNGEKTTYQSLRFPDAPEGLAPSPVRSQTLTPSKPDSDGTTNDLEKK